MREREDRLSLQAEESALRQRASEIQENQETRAQETHESSLLRHESQLKASAQARATSAAQQTRLEKQNQWDEARKLREEQETNVKAMAPVEFKRVLEGGAFSPEFLEASQGTQYDPRFMAKPEYKQAAKTAFETVDGVMTKYREDPNSINVTDYNQPDFIGAMNVLLSPSVNRGVGDKDPNTGKAIEQKEIVSVLPSPDGKGMVFDVKTTLSDGSSYVAPITENRTTDPDDPVKVVPIGDLMDTINGSMQMASAFEKSDLKNYMTANFPVGGSKASESSKETTRRQWLREQGDIDKWETEQINEIDPMTMTEEEQAAKVEKIKQQANDRRARIDERYGNVQTSVGAEGSKMPTPSGGGEVRTDINTWAEGDLGKRRFIEQAQIQADARGVANPFLAYSPSELDAIYREFMNDSEADELAAELM
jgi:hypothetical protein